MTTQRRDLTSKEHEKPEERIESVRMRIGNCAYEHTTIEASTRYDVHVTRSGILPTRHVTPATYHAKSAAIHVAANDEMPLYTMCRLDSNCITAITMLRFTATAQGMQRKPHFW